MGPNESRNLWISLGAGIFATFMLYSYTQEKKAEVDKTLGEKVRVVVAKEDIREMDSIFDNVVEVQEKYKADVEPDAYRDVPDLVGLVAAIPIKKGQTITKNKVLEPGPETGMALQVSPNKRAVTIPVNDQQANAKLIRPGDRVDVMALVETGKGATAKREMVVLQQDVVILATGVNVQNNLPRTIEKDPSGRGLVQTTLTGDTKYNTLTVEARIDEAQDLLYLVATNSSSIYFLLRNPHDRKQLGRLPSSTAETIQYKAMGQAGTQSSYGTAAGFSGQTQPNLNNPGGLKPGN